MNRLSKDIASVDTEAAESAYSWGGVRYRADSSLGHLRSMRLFSRDGIGCRRVLHASLHVRSHRYQRPLLDRRRAVRRDKPGDQAYRREPKSEA